VEDIGTYEDLTKESLRGRTGGAVTLAVGMAHIFDGAAKRISVGAETSLRSMWKYWYHFAIMFEALFILTTIDAGTRIARFLLQEVMGRVHPKLGKPDWWPAAIVSTVVIVAGWAWFMNSDQFSTIWAMFGIANQMLAVIALAVVSVWLVNEGRARYLWVTAGPMLCVLATTTTAAAEMLAGQIDGFRTQLANPATAERQAKLIAAALQGGMILVMLVCTAIILAAGVVKVWNVLVKEQPPKRGFEPVTVG
jgi:carbon starvation protein